MVVAVTVPDDGAVRRRERTVAAFAALIALLLGVAATPADALLPTKGLVAPTVAVLDPALQDVLGTAASGDVIEVAVVLPQIPTSSDLTLLRSTGAVVAG